jgi:hypothetical protein
MAKNEANGVRVQKWVKVYSPESNVVYDGVLLDDGGLERLAGWLHEHWCYAKITDSSDKTLKKAGKQAAKRGYCDDCRDFAANLLSECPYLDMSRPDQLVLGEEGMEWRARSAKIPDHKVCAPINQRRRALMGI